MTLRFKPSHLHASDTDNGGALLQLIWSWHGVGWGVQWNRSKTECRNVCHKDASKNNSKWNASHITCLWQHWKCAMGSKMFLLRVKGGGHTRKMLHTPHQFSLQIVSKMVQTTILFSITQITYLWHVYVGLCICGAQHSSVSVHWERKPKGFNNSRKLKKVDFKKTEEFFFLMCCYCLNLP